MYTEKRSRKPENCRYHRKIHTESPDKGYRRIRDELERYYNIKVNDKGYSGFAVRKESNQLLSILTMDVQDRRQIPSLLQKTF